MCFCSGRSSPTIGWPSLDSATTLRSNYSWIITFIELLLCRYWAVAVPVFGCVCFTMIFFLYIGANLLMVPAPDDLRNITGQFDGVKPSCVQWQMYNNSWYNIPFVYSINHLWYPPSPHYTDSYSLPPQPASIGTSVPPLYDIPITEVNKLMFAKKHWSIHYLIVWESSGEHYMENIKSNNYFIALKLDQYLSLLHLCMVLIVRVGYCTPFFLSLFLQFLPYFSEFLINFCCF